MTSAKSSSKKSSRRLSQLFVIGFVIVGAAVTGGTYYKFPVLTGLTQFFRPSNMSPSSPNYSLSSRDGKIANGANVFGCVDPSIFEHTQQYLLNNDQATFQRVFTAAVVDGRCVSFIGGEAVSLQDGLSVPGMVEVQRGSDGKIYWTSALFAN